MILSLKSWHRFKSFENTSSYWNGFRFTLIEAEFELFAIIAKNTILLNSKTEVTCSGRSVVPMAGLPPLCLAESATDIFRDNSTAFKTLIMISCGTKTIPSYFYTVSRLWKKPKLSWIKERCGQRSPCLTKTEQLQRGHWI